jgi:hypothetical protein
MNENIFKAENLQLLTASSLGRGEDHVMSREMMCAVVDALTPPVRRLLMLCGFNDREEPSGKMCTFDLRRENWTVIETPTFNFRGLQLGGRAVLFRDSTVLMTTGSYNMFIDVDQCFDCGQKQCASCVVIDSKGGFECNPTSSILNLDDGGTLILGGTKKNGPRALHNSGPSHRVYNEICNEWLEVSTRKIPLDACCVVMRGGRVLIAGGRSSFDFWNHELKCCSVYHVESRRFTQTNRMEFERTAAAGCLLPDGTVFVCGGNTDTCEIYTPATRKWTRWADMCHRRTRHTCTLISETQVLIAGGASINGTRVLLPRCEIYDFIAKTTRAVQSMPIDVTGHSMIPLYK